MKKLIYHPLIMMLLLIPATSCRTTRTLTPSTNIKVIHDTTTTTRIVPIVTPADSALIRAHLECDKNGRVLLSWYDNECGKNTSLRLQLDSLNNLLIKARHESTTQDVTVTDTTIRNDSIVEKIVPYEVEKSLTRWQQFYITLGKISGCIIIAAVLFAIFCLRKKLKKLIGL